MAQGANGLAEEIRARAAGRREPMVSDLAAVTALDAPSGDPGALGRAAAEFARLLERGGTAVRRHQGPAGPHLEARFGPGGEGGVLILCHYDTVWPLGTVAERPFRLRDGAATGPGVFDMRGGVVAALSAIEILRELDSLTRPVAVLLTADEETGAPTSRELIVERGRSASITLVPEPPLPGGALKTSRRAVSTYRVAVRGRSSHAGLDPEAGVSAIDELVDQLVAIRALADPARGTSVNVGVVAGGTVANCIAGAAEAQIDARAAEREEAERIRYALEALEARRDGALIEVRELQSRPPMERTKAIARAFARARAIGKGMGLELEEGNAGGGSDGSLVAAAGLAVLDGLGPEGGGAHAPDEWVSVDSIVDRAALIALLVAEL